MVNNFKIFTMSQKNQYYAQFQNKQCRIKTTLIRETHIERTKQYNSHIKQKMKSIIINNKVLIK